MVTPTWGSTDGTPPHIINYDYGYTNPLNPSDSLNRPAVVPLELRTSVQAFEQLAVLEVLQTHSLPSSDAAAVKGWARNAVRAQMWADLTRLIKKDPASRTAVENDVYTWFRGVVQQQNIRAALATRAEYLKYSGRTLDDYLTNGADPLNFNGETKESSSGGYCLYRPPTPYQNEFNASGDQSCFTAPGIPVGFLAPSPTYDQFVKYGQYIANSTLISSQDDFNRTSFEVAAVLSGGVAMAIGLIGVPLAVSLTSGIAGSVTTGAAIFRAVFPFAARGVALGVGVAAGAVAAVVGTVILAIVTIVLASIQIAEAVDLPVKIGTLLTKTQNEPPDLRSQLLEDDARAAATSKTEEERKPLYYGGYYTIFLTTTLPEADPEPCQGGGLVIGTGSLYTVGCINSPAIPPARLSDPKFEVTPQGSSTSTIGTSVAVKLPDNLGEQSTRLSGNGWFVHTPVGGTASVTQSLALTHLDWEGKPWVAQRIYDATNGFRFVRIRVGDDASASTCAVATDCIVDRLQLTRPDGSKVTVRAVPSTAPVITATVPTAVEQLAFATFSAVATPARTDLTYTWTFPPICTTNFCPTPVFDLSGTIVHLDGAEVQYLFDVLGPQQVRLTVADPSGFSETQTFSVNITASTKVPDTITIQPLSLQVGDVKTATATSAAGIPVTLSGGGACTLVGTTVTATAAGNCTITAAHQGSSTVRASSTTVVVPVSLKTPALTVSFDTPPGGMPYGTQTQLLVQSSTGLDVNIALDPSSANVCVLSNSMVRAVGLGTCSITVSSAATSEYMAGLKTVSVQVIPAKVTVTAKKASIVYGATAPSYGFDTSPLIAVPGVICTAATAPAVGVYPTGISCSGGDAGPNYVLTYVPDELTVTPRPITVPVTPAAVQYSDAVPNLNVAGQITGLVGNDQLTGTLTGCTASGLVTATGTVALPAGNYALTGCTGLMNPNYSVSYAGALSVTAEHATLAYDGAWYISTGTGSTGSATMNATMKQAADGALGDLTKAKVDFLLFKTTNFTTTPDYRVNNVAVSAAGAITAVATGLVPETYHVVVRQSGGTGYFSAADAVDDLTVYTPVAGTSASGGGWIVDSSAGGDQKGHFGFSVAVNKQLAVQGQVTYRWRDASNGYDYVVRSNSWNGGGALFNKSTVALTVKANLTVVDPATGLVVTALSGGNHLMKMAATDNGTVDTYSVTILNQAGAVVHQVATVTVSGGNLTVRA